MIIVYHIPQNPILIIKVILIDPFKRNPLKEPYSNY